MQAVMASLVFEGVFERFPKLRICLIESGFTWVPALTWRMDRQWERMRKEVPHVKRPPSEYVREHFWFATQPIEEPERHNRHRLTVPWRTPAAVLHQRVSLSEQAAIAAPPYPA